MRKVIGKKFFYNIKFLKHANKKNEPCQYPGKIEQGGNEKHNGW